MTWADIVTAMQNCGDALTNAMGVISGNAGLMVIFAGGIITVGFRLFKKAKRAVK